VTTRVGSFLTGTGALGTTVAVTGLGFQPKFVMFWWGGTAGATDLVSGTLDISGGFGWATGASNRACVGFSMDDAAATTAEKSVPHSAACIMALSNAGAVTGLIDFQSFDAGGFTLVVDDVMPLTLRVHYLASDESPGGQVAGEFTTTAGAATTTVTGLPFQPDIVFLLSTGKDTTNGTSAADCTFQLGVAKSSAASDQAIIAIYADDAVADAATGSYCRLGECYAGIFAASGTLRNRTTLASMNSDGFTLTHVDSPLINVRTFYLALKGGAYHIGSITTATNTTAFAETGVPFQPTGALFASACSAESTTAESQHLQLSIGATDDVPNRRALGFLSEDLTSSTQATVAIEHDEVYVNLSTADALEGLMDVNAVTSDGFTMQMDDADPVASFVWYAAFGVGSVPNDTVALVGKTVASPSFPTFVISTQVVNFPIALVGKTVASPSFPTLVIGTQAVNFPVALVGKTVASPTFPTLAISQNHVLSLVGKTVASPTFPTLAISQVHTLALVGKTVASPTFPTLAVTQVHATALVGKTVASPTFPTLAITQVHGLSLVGETVAAPTIPNFVIGTQVLNFPLALVGKTVASPSLPTFVISEDVATTNVDLVGLTVASPSLPTLVISTQAVNFSIALVGLTVPSPSITPLGTTQVHNIYLYDLTVGRWLPNQLTNRTFEFDARREITVVSGRVSRWGDLAGNHHAANNTAGTRPLAGTNEVIFGDAGLARVLGAGTLPSNDPTEGIYGVYTETNNTSTNTLVGSSTAAGRQWRRVGTAGVEVLRQASVAGPQQAVSYPAVNTPFIAGVGTNFAGTTHEYSFNGTVYIRTGGSSALAAGGFTWLGHAHTTEYHRGSIKHLVRTSEKLADADREKLEGFFAHTWDGVHGDTVLADSLRSDHPYKSVPPGAGLILPTFVITEQAAGVTDVVLSELTVAAPSLPTLVVTHTHVLSLVGLTVPSPALPTLAITQAHALSLVGKTVASPSLPALAITQAHGLALQGKTVVSPSMPVLAISQVHSLALQGKVVASPSLPTLQIAQGHALSLSGLTVGSPSLPTLAALQAHSLALQGLSLGAPSIPNYAIGGSGNVFLGGKTVASPSLPALAITQVQTLALQGKVVASPSLPTLVVAQAQVLALVGKTVGVPTLPTLVASQAHSLALVGKAVASPTLPAFVISTAQRNFPVLLSGLTVGSPVLPTLGATQRHVLSLQGKVVGAPSLGTLVISTAQVNFPLLLGGLTISVPVVETLVISTAQRDFPFLLTELILGAPQVGTLVIAQKFPFEPDVIITISGKQVGLDLDGSQTSREVAILGTKQQGGLSLTGAKSASMTLVGRRSAITVQGGS
jgi:hypothetical protein